MKRLITCMIIFIGIIGLCCWGTVTLKSRTTHMIGLLQQAHDAAAENKLDKALELTNEFLSKWEENEAFFIYILRHEQMDEVTFSSSRLPSFLLYGDRAEFCAEASEVIKALEHLWNTEKPILENFF